MSSVAGSGGSGGVVWNDSRGSTQALLLGGEWVVWNDRRGSTQALLLRDVRRKVGQFVKIDGERLKQEEPLFRIRGACSTRYVHGPLSVDDMKRYDAVEVVIAAKEGKRP